MKSSSSSENVVRVTEDLSDCRNRLEAGIEENRRNRQVIQNINDQLQRYRQKVQAESVDSFPQGSASLLGSDIHLNPAHTHQNISMPSLTIDIPLNTHTTIHSARYYNNTPIEPSSSLRHKSLGSRGETFYRYRSTSPIGRHRSSPRLLSYEDGQQTNDDENIEQLFGRLKDELFKNNTLEEVNEMLREENDAALTANEHLRVDATNLSKQLQVLQQQQHTETMRFRAENTRYRNQVETQHRKLISLWKEFTAVKRQLHELKTSTANDMDRQLTEFTRCAALMKKAIRTAEQKNIESKDRMKREKDDILDETLRQLNTITENYMKSEEKANDRMRELKLKDEEVRKLKEQNEEYSDILEQLSRMTYEMGSNRARSQSPQLPRISYKENPMDVARKMRKLLSTKNGEIDESKEAVRQAEKDRDRAKKDLEKEEKRRREERESERKRSSIYSQREQDLKTLEDDLKKAQEKIKKLEEQKESQEKLTLSVQNSLSDAHRQHKEFIEELMVRHREELKEREVSYDDLLKNRSSDEKSRLEKERNDRDKIRKENDDLKENLRALKSDLAAIKTDFEDKMMRSDVIENEREELKKKLEDERKQNDEKDMEIAEFRNKIDEMQEKEADLRKQLVDAQENVESMEGSTKLNEEQFLETKNELSTMMEQIESLNMELEGKNEEVQNLKQDIQEKEKVIQTIRTSSHTLTATYEEANGEIDVLKVELTRLHDQLNDRTRQISNINEKLDEALRKNDILMEDTAIWQEKFETSRKEIEEMERKKQEKMKEENELKSLLDDLRANFDKLTNDLKQKNITADGLNDEILMLKEQLKKSEKDRKDDVARLEESEKRNEADLKEDYEAKLKFVEKDKEGLDKFARETEGRLNEVTKIHELLIEEHDQLKIDHLHTNEEVEKLKEKLKNEMEKANEQNEADRVEWANERHRLETSKNETIQELQSAISKLEDSLKEKEDREVQLRKDLEDAQAQISHLEEQVRKLQGDDEEKEEDRKNELKIWNEEKMKLMEEKGEAVLNATKHATTIDQQNRKIANFETDVDKLNIIIADKDSTIHALESNTMELISKCESTEQELEKLKDELAIMLKQNADLKNGKEGLTEKWSEEKRKIQELSDQLRDANKNLHNIRMKNVNLEEKKNEIDQNNTVLNNKIKQLELQLMDKSAKNEVSGDLLRKMEHDAQNMLKQAQNEQYRMSDLEKTRKALHDENQRLANDLSTVKAAFEAKRESSKSAISDILVQYRKSEERANEQALENQKLRSELQTATIRLERLDNKTKDMETKLKETHRRHEDVQSKLEQFQRSALESLQHPISTQRPNRSLYVDIPRAASSMGLNDSSDDGGSMRRTPSVRFADSSSNIQRTVDSMDVSSSVGVTLRFLKERIEQLEIDKAELNDYLDKLKDDLREKNEKLSEKQMTVERLERQLIHTTEEKTTIEARMNSQRQLYLTNEESSRSREHETRSMKARISSFELHLREKESKISHLKKELDVLHGQLHDAIESKNKIGSMVGEQESRYREIEEQFERAARERDSATARVRRLSVENENFVRKLEQYEKEREQLMREISDERRINEKSRSMLEELKSNEKKQAATHAKKSVEVDERAIQDQKRKEEIQNELTNRNMNLSRECDRLRIEMRDQLNRMNTINLKTIDSDRKNEELSSKLLTLQNNVDALKRFEMEWKRLELEMRNELKVLRKEKLVHTSEIEDLKRRNLRNETEKKEIEGIRIRLEREISALKRHLDALEEEKGKTEHAVKETMNERRAIDKSLASMERENQQLYRNCAQLQAQIQQLERDAGNRSVAKLAKEHTLLEARIASLIEEKRQLQSMLDQKDSSYSHKRKLLESQIQLLREQLESERRKRAQKPAVVTGPASRKIVQHSSAFRRTIEHRSVSCERVVMEQNYQKYIYSDQPTIRKTTTIMNQTPPISPLSHSDSYTSGTLIM